MNNLQLLLTIGIPGILVILSWLSNNSKWERSEKRMDAFEQRIEKRLDDIDKRIDGVTVSGHKDALEIMRNMTDLHERVAVVESRQNNKS